MYEFPSLGTGKRDAGALFFPLFFVQIPVRYYPTETRVVVLIFPGNVVRLAPEDESSPIRTFYLRLPTKKEAEEWADAIRGTRFVSVREERDALRSAKTVLTEQVRRFSGGPVKTGGFSRFDRLTGSQTLPVLVLKNRIITQACWVSKNRS